MKPFYFDSFYRHGEKHVTKFCGDADKPVLFWAFITTVKHHDQKASWVGKCLFGMHFHTAVHL